MSQFFWTLARSVGYRPARGPAYTEGNPSYSTHPDVSRAESKIYFEKKWDLMNTLYMRVDIWLWVMGSIHPDQQINWSVTYYLVHVPSCPRQNFSSLLQVRLGCVSTKHTHKSQLSTKTLFPTKSIYLALIQALYIYYKHTILYYITQTSLMVRTTITALILSML